MKQAATLRCYRCKESKDASDFYKGNTSWCKPCVRQDYVNRKDKVRWAQILKHYGITQDTYVEMFEAQGGVCDICKKPETNKRFKFLAVDHDHSTGKVRSLLCHRCNAGLGNFYDDIELLRSSVEYLQKHQVPSNSASEQNEATEHKLNKLREDVRACFSEFVVERNLVAPNSHGVF